MQLCLGLGGCGWIMKGGGDGLWGWGATGNDEEVYAMECDLEAGI